MKRAVILVDLQADFTECKGGTLAVPGTDWSYIKKVEETLRWLKEQGWMIFATQDWHPPQHISFYTNHPGKKPFEEVELPSGRKQRLWPPHCIQGTEGARILVDNNLFLGVIQKGRHPHFDSYSAFKDDGGNETELDSILKFHKITDLLIFGLATDYCVKATAIDALEKGYRVTVVLGLSRGVAPDTTESAVKEMKEKGSLIVLNLPEALG